jgi:LemA protein
MGEIMALYAVCGILAVVLAWAVLNYNGLVRLRQHCRESWAGIDTELKRRYDLIPNLVETVQGYAAHEREVLQSVTEARTRAVAATGAPGLQAAEENVLIDALKRLLVVVEHYPDLKASAHFLELQRELANTEDRIQAARRFYNANVRDMNTRIEAFPSNLIAAMFRFRRQEFFEIADAGIRSAPQAEFN